MKVRKIAKRAPKFLTRHWNEEVVRIADALERDGEEALRAIQVSHVRLPGYEDVYTQGPFTIEFKPQHQPKIIEWINVSTLGEQVQKRVVGGVK
ncbi:hypothetical protein H1O16_gp376 [Burkholderia phage BcepSaruman]|uniref:Uncharacterized protein n=1 Tax=Burkholderia phage BcepSaruman TaxID=2530032 RepID=A0A4D5ZDK9_9CAUD|nr:hypothetical protein H1O16_gp376 [Burkholderia phage BcepSaruman]QBX06789.1 hypothetical protein BcepSaruman_376 [Burkholderia phage BcepSaruman]